MLRTIGRFENLLAIGTSLMPFTLLRVGFIGVGEIIIVLLFFSELSNGAIYISKKNLIFSRFWVLFLLVSSVGYFINLIYYDLQFGSVESAVFDLSSYILVLITVFTIEIRNRRTHINFISLGKALFFTSSILLTILYAISLYSESIFGLSLRYFGSFAPLASNIHQTSMFIVPLPFLGIFLIKHFTKVKYKLAIYFFLTALLLMIIDFRSFKAIVGFGLGLAVWCSFALIRQVGVGLRTFMILLLISAIVLCSLIFFDSISDFLFAIFAEEDIEGGRNRLYSKGIEVGLKSPVFGLGPGPHLWGGLQYWDAHQTLLTAFLQAGIFGVFLVIWLFYKIIMKIWSYAILVAYIVPICIYALGGDIFRRLPIWILLVFVFYLGSQLRERKFRINMSN